MKGLEHLRRWLVPVLLMEKFFLNARLKSPLLPLECIFLALDLEHNWFTPLCKTLYIQGEWKRVLPEPLLL